MKRVIILLWIILTMIPSTTYAQWSTDPAVNNQVSFGNSGAAVSYIATHPCGTSFFTWFTPEPPFGYYFPYIQQLDVNGYAQWTDPIKISSHPSMTWITDYALAPTPDTGALVAFQDTRTGNNDLFIYKMGKDGSFLWGNDGVQLSATPDFEANPSIAAHSDGSAVVVWPKMPNTGDYKVVMQRLNSAGQKTWASDKVLSESGFDYTWPKAIAVEEGSTIVVWYKEWGYMSAPNRIIFAQKFDSTGYEIWPSKAVLFEGVMPVYVHPSVVSDGSGGIFVSWMYERVSNHLSSFVQHVTSDGLVTMEADGAEVSLDANKLALEPFIGCDESDHSVYIFWRSSDLNQNVFGMSGQRMDIYGNRKWGNNGIAYEPLGNMNPILPVINGLPGGAIVCYEINYSASGSDQMIKAIRVDSTGSKVWNPVYRTVSSAMSSKSGLAAGIRSNSQVIYSWSDDRTGSEQVFAQNLSEDGNFGPIDDSFEVNPDTLWFLTGDDIVDGKQFHIVNPHGYSLDIQYIQQFGDIDPTLAPWYTTPFYNTFPVNILPNDSIGITVRWYAVDNPEVVQLAYDTLMINTINDTNHVIIAVDPIYIHVGINGEDDLKFSTFPNPFRESLIINLDPVREMPVEITVFNMMMQAVLTLFKGNLCKGKGNLMWDGMDSNGSQVPAGVYTIIVKTQGGMRSMKIIRL